MRDVEQIGLELNLLINFKLYKNSYPEYIKYFALWVIN